MHMYELNGNQYPSVTTIIHALGNDEITKWANSLGFRHINYEKELNKYAENGTMIHDLLREEVDPAYKSSVIFKDDIQRGEALGYLTRFRSFLNEYKYETIFTEKTFISETLGYAGTLDWLCKFNEKYLMLNDFKTSKAVRFTHLLQLGGYYNLLHENGFQLDGASIILCNKKVCSMYPINLAELQYYAEAFSILAKYYIMTYNKAMRADTGLLNDIKA